MQLELAICGSRARDTGESRLAAPWTELLGHFFGREEACMTAEDIGAQSLNALAGRGEEVEVHLEEHILHGEVGGYGCDSHLDGLQGF